MPLTKIKKRIAVASTGLFAASLCALPFAPTASAAPMGSIGENNAVHVQTEYNCRTHSLTTEVKNKLSTDINPTLTFEQMSPDDPGRPPFGGNGPRNPIKPNESQSYIYDFTGGDQVIPVRVAVDGHEALVINPLVACNDPVNFRVTEFSDKTVIGYLTNTNSQYPQSVTLTPSTGSRQDITLEPGQTVLASVPYAKLPQQTGLSVEITNGPGFMSSYFIDLTQPLPPQIPIGAGIVAAPATVKQ